MNANGQMLDSLANSQMFRDYERAYNETTGLPLALRATESWQIPLHGKRKENSWCSLMASKSATCAACLQMQEKLAKSASNEPASVKCEYGLCEMAVPVKLGNDPIGYLQTGQVLCQKPSNASFERALQKARDHGIEVDDAEAREAYFGTPVLSQKKLDSLSRLLVIFAEHLAIKSNQIAVQSVNAEPPVITRAKQFIEEHHTEDLCLEQVARAVHTSIFYFCKLFKKATGINFTEYVSRVRAEKAKDLLLNPHLRVSEIAYEVGFQSLTHFNRVFKKIVGQSPTEYRAQLPAMG